MSTLWNPLKNACIIKCNQQNSLRFSHGLAKRMHFEEFVSGNWYFVFVMLKKRNPKLG